MKNFLIALALFGSVASAQQTVTVTRTEIGEVVSVDRPIHDNIQSQSNCSVPHQLSRPHRNLNSGTVLGGIVGGLAGAQVGDGRGRDAAIAAGAITGAMIGNDINRDVYHDPRNRSHCVHQENRIVGWAYTLNVNGVLIESTSYSQRPPYIGQQVYVTVTSSFRPQI